MKFHLRRAYLLTGALLASLVWGTMGPVPTASATEPEVQVESSDPCAVVFPIFGNSRDSRTCVNGTEPVSTRGYNRCLTMGRSLEPAVYTAQECFGNDPSKMYVEAIAQARLVQKLDPGYGGATGSTISRSTEWEVRAVDVSHDRADYVFIGPDTGHPALNAVRVAEIKLASNGGAASALAQANAYVTEFKSLGWQNTELANLTGYYDRFLVVRRCADPTAGIETQEYEAIGGMGVVIVNILDVDGDCGNRYTKFDSKSEEDQAKNVLAGSITGGSGDDPVVNDVEITSSRSTSAFVPLEVKLAVVAVGATAVVRGIQATQRYLLERAVVRAATRMTQSVAFETLKLEVCSAADNVVNPGDPTSIGTVGLTCMQFNSIGGMAGYLASVGYVIDDETIAEMGLDEELDMAGASSPALVRGDPRLVTLDGLNYDFHGVGEYRLLFHDESSFEVQMRTFAVANDMSGISAIAVRTEDQLVELFADGTVEVNSEPFVFDSSGVAYLSNGVLLSRIGGSIELRGSFDAAGEQPVVTWTPQRGSRADFAISVPRSWANATRGMLGNYDGNPGNDLVSASGVDVTGNLGFGVDDQLYLARLYGTFGDSWRVTNDNALFTYEGNESTSTFTDFAYPRGVTSLGDFDALTISNAWEICVNAGLQPGIAFDDCILDVAASGDASFATSLATIAPFGVSLGDVKLGDDPVTVTFDGEIPPNFFPRRVRSLADGANIAGPYVEGDSYGFYLTELQGHSGLIVTTEVVLPSAGEGFPALRIGQTSVAGVVVDGSERPATLADGQVGNLVTIRYQIPHSARDVVAELVVNSAWAAVLSLSVDLERVPAEEFDLDLVAGQRFLTSDRTGWSGVGLLEYAGAVDRYCFDASEFHELYLDPRQLREDLGWLLTSKSSGQLIAAGSTGEPLLADVTGGACIEVFVDGSSVPNYWTYQLEFLLVPAPDVVDLGLLSQVPVTGSGNFETKVSVDEFTFEVPEGGSRVVIELGGVFYGGRQYNVWQLVDADGVVVASGARRTGATRFDQVLPAGQYRLINAPESDKTGVWGFRAYLPPDSQGYDLTLSKLGYTSVSNGVPSSGAGNLETWLSRDVYTFVAQQGDALSIDQLDSYGAHPSAVWQVTDASGVVVGEGTMKSDAIVEGLAGGTYQWTVFFPDTSTYNGGTYKTNLLLVPAPDVVDLGLLSQVPVTGSGNFETKVSVDEFTFEVPEGGSRVVIELGGVFYGGRQYNVWQLVDADGVVVASGARRTGATRFDQVLPAGQYRLINAPESDKTGVWGFRAYLPPSAQEFSVALSSATPLVVTNGKPAVGAGNLETWLSRDVFTFSVNQSSHLDIDQTWTYEAHKSARWALTDATGVVVAQGPMSADARVASIPPGTYHFTVFFPDTSTYNGGTYKTNLLLVPAN